MQYQYRALEITKAGEAITFSHIHGDFWNTLNGANARSTWHFRDYEYINIKTLLGHSCIWIQVWNVVRVLAFTRAKHGRGDFWNTLRSLRTCISYKAYIHGITHLKMSLCFEEILTSFHYIKLKSISECVRWLSLQPYASINLRFASRTNHTKCVHCALYRQNAALSVAVHIAMSRFWL